MARMLPELNGISPLDVVTDPSNLGERWKKWHSRFENYTIAANISSDQRKKALLLHFIGEEAFEIFQSLPDPPAQDPPLTSYEQTVQKLTDFFEPKINTDFEVFKFRETTQQPAETIDQYYARLLKLAKTCSFHDENNEIKSHIILTTTNTELRKYGLTEKPDLEKLLNKARTLEATKSQINKIEQRETADKAQRVTHSLRSHKQQTNKNFRPNQQNNQKCKNCGNAFHQNGKQTCPARNITCFKCNKTGHFGKVCLSSNNNRNTRQEKHKNARVNFASQQNSETDSDTDKSFRINVCNKLSVPTVQVKLNNKYINFIIDTGSSVNIINNKTFEQLQTEQLNKKKYPIFPYNSTDTLQIIGKFTGIVKYKTKQVRATFVVVEGNGEALLSYNTSRELGLVQITYLNTQQQTLNIQQLEKEFPQVFQGVGNLKEFQIKLHIDHTVTPISQTNRRIPFHQRSKVETELKRLTEADVLEKVTEPTDWISPIVIVPKPSDPNAIRICVDMRAANKAIQRIRTVTPTTDDLIIQLNGAQHFSKLDLREGYHQLTLSPKSRNITTFATHLGLYRYKRLNFGVNTAAEIFQDVIRQTLQDIPNAINISDDIIIFGKTQQEHDNTLKEVLNRLCKKGLTVNKKKCQINSNSIRFFGHIFSNKGISPDPEKIKSITALEPPNNQGEVKSFLGMINFVSKFIPNISENTKHLRELSREKIPWNWTSAHLQEFNKIKKLVANYVNLNYFQINKEANLYVDAGPKGLGAILTQSSENNIVAIASRSLSPTEQRCSHIEKEMLAISWAVNHFILYLTGNKFTIHTDHKALVNILQNPRTAPSARIERLCLKIQHHNFTIVHQEGKTNPSDYLSRHPSHEQSTNTKTEDYVNFIITQNTPKKLNVAEIAKATKQDSFLTELKTALKNDTETDWNTPNLKPYKKIRTEFTTANNIILRNHRIVIPAALQHKTITLAHRGHQGIVKTKQLLRSKVWFPKLDSLTEQEIRKCMACQITDTRKYREPPLTRELPNKPFINVDVDYAGPFPNNEYIFLLVDEYSRYPIIEVIKSTAFHHLKPILEKTFALFGIPKKLTSDNGPPFNGKEFTNFLTSYNIKHHPVTPEWPQANGMVERLVKTVKRSFTCAHFETRNFHSQLQDFLINYRSTPHSTTNKSPFELVFNRTMSNFLPDNDEIQNETIEEQKNQNVQKEERKEERGNEKTRTFNIGDNVLCKQKKKNTLTPNFDPTPYKIIKIEGTKITAKRPDKTITRNKSFFKLLTNPKLNPDSSIQTQPHSYTRDLKQTRGNQNYAPISFDDDQQPDDNEGSTASEDESSTTSDASMYSPGSSIDTSESPDSTPGKQTPKQRPQRQARKPTKFDDYEID